jgi:phage shock protein C
MEETPRPYRRTEGTKAQERSRNHHSTPSSYLRASPQKIKARDHTIVGVCEALGEDLGISPILLRIAFAAGLFFSPFGALAAYAALGALVALTRFVAPEPKPAEAAEAEAVAAEKAEAPADPEMALAA